jgi:hypothetical protein
MRSRMTAETGKTSPGRIEASFRQTETGFGAVLFRTLRNACDRHTFLRGMELADVVARTDPLREIRRMLEKICPAAMNRGVADVVRIVVKMDDRAEDRLGRETS